MRLGDGYPVFLHPLQMKFDGLMNKLRNLSTGFTYGYTAR